MGEVKKLQPHFITIAITQVINFYFTIPVSYRNLTGHPVSRTMRYSLLMPSEYRELNLNGIYVFEDVGLYRVSPYEVLGPGINPKIVYATGREGHFTAF